MLVIWIRRPEAELLNIRAARGGCTGYLEILPAPAAADVEVAVAGVFEIPVLVCAAGAVPLHHIGTVVVCPVVNVGSFAARIDESCALEDVM